MFCPPQASFWPPPYKSTAFFYDENVHLIPTEKSRINNTTTFLPSPSLYLYFETRVRKKPIHQISRLICSLNFRRALRASCRNLDNGLIWEEVSPGTDVMIFKIFSPKIFAKKLAFLTQNKAKFWKKLIIILVFKKNANFFSPKIGKNRRKLWS
jgi:hypothetical protein